MSQTPPTSSSNLQAIFCASLDTYKKKTEKDLLAHPLMVQLETFNSPTDTLAILRTQVHQFQQSTSDNDRLTSWLNPTVNVLYTCSAALGEGVGLVFSPATVIFDGAGVLLLAAKDVVASQDTLIKIFKRIESFLRRLEEYSAVPMTEAMKDINVKIMVEVLEIFGIVTEEMKQGGAQRYLKKLIGRRDIEDAWVRLDRLTQQEVQMAIVQVPKVAHDVEDGVQTIGEQVLGVGDNVNLAVEDGKVIKATILETNALVQQAANYMDEEKRSQIRTKHRAWLSPPDPSTNQNLASNIQHQGTATWFFQGSIFFEWKSKSTTSLLWIHGKPGSGKSILCSAIIQDITALREAGLASMAYFYFDFKDADKRNIRNLLPSLLTQLSARSDICCDILSRIYKAHDDGTHKPSTSTLIGCLKEMLALPGLGPIYIIMDALDECPNTTGVPPDRKQVLDLIKDLVGLRLSDFHICITSRPEDDIRAALEPQAFHTVSIHEESGQKKDIEDYIRSVVYAESDTAMRRWREKDRELVIEMLTDRADGMFRWVFCQLEVLQHCLPQSILRTLNELPKSLDETYERVLKEIGMANRDHAHRLLQCLTVAARPLRVEELAEILALDFEDAEGATPKLKEDWRQEDRRRAVLSTCSSLITEVNDGDSRVIQFTHFSVKEFLTSDRLANSKGDASYFHITPDSAHTTLAQACLGTLLQLDVRVVNRQNENRFPLARYASQYWVEHAQFGKVSSRIKDGMRLFFDSTKLHLYAWVRLYDIDDRWNTFGDFLANRGSPLYYASLLGFHDLAAQIILEHPEQVNARGGYNHSPLAAALHKRHFDVAELLHRHGATVDVINQHTWTLLHAASFDGRIDVARWLLDHGADANSPKGNHCTPIQLAACTGRLEVVQMLLEHNVPVNTANSQGVTPLHHASDYGHVEIAGLLLEHGAEINAQDSMDYLTPLHLASRYGRLEAARLLLDRGANVEAKKKDGRTPLHEMSWFGSETDIVRLLLDHGANPNAEDNEGWTPLHEASSTGKAEIARLLLDRGANVNSKTEDGRTPLHDAWFNRETEIARLLLDHGANVDSKKEDGRTPLHEASYYGPIEIVQLLLDHHANVNANDKDGWTPLHVASSKGEAEIVRLLLNRGASADSKDKEGKTPFQVASNRAIKQMLTEHGGQ